MKEKFKFIQNSLEALQQDENFLKQIDRGLKALIKSLADNKKILIAGDGGSATQASHMTGEIVGRFKCDRPAMAAVSLYDLAATTAISNDYGYSQVFSRFVQGLGQPGDVLFSLSTSGNSQNCLEAMDMAKKKNLVNITLLGKDGGKMKELSDIAIVVPCDDTPLIQEIHLMIIHYLCQEIEKYFITSSETHD